MLARMWCGKFFQEVSNVTLTTHSGKWYTFPQLETETMNTNLLLNGLLLLALTRRGAERLV